MYGPGWNAVVDATMRTLPDPRSTMSGKKSLVNSVSVTMTLTAIGCPVAGEVMADVESRVMSVPNVEKCNVTLTFDPPWTTDRMTEDAKWELGIS